MRATAPPAVYHVFLLIFSLLLFCQCFPDPGNALGIYITWNGAICTDDDAYASGLGIVDGFIKEQIVLIPLKDTLGYVTSKQKKLSTICSAFIQEIKKSLSSHQEGLDLDRA